MTGTLPTYTFENNIAIIRMDDGKANVFSFAVVEALHKHLDQAAADKARSLVLIGRPGKFSAGFDLGEMTASPESARSLVAAGAHLWLRIYGLEIPTVAACTGHALAGGAITLMSCDLRIGADVPSKIGLNEVAIGLVLPKFAVELARERIAKSHFTAATMGAQIYDPAGAKDAGFLDLVVPEQELEAVATQEAARLGLLRTGAYGATKANARAMMIAEVGAGVEADMASIDIPEV